MADTDALLARSPNTAAAVTLSINKNTSEMLTDLIPHSKLVPNVEKRQCFAQIDSWHALLLLLLAKDGAVLVVIRCRLRLVSTQMERSWLAVWIVIKDVGMLAPQQLPLKLLKLRILLKRQLITLLLILMMCY
jgi:hypothetical protein